MPQSLSENSPVVVPALQPVGRNSSGVNVSKSGSGVSSVRGMGLTLIAFTGFTVAFLGGATQEAMSQTVLFDNLAQGTGVYNASYFNIVLGNDFQSIYQSVTLSNANAQLSKIDVVGIHVTPPPDGLPTPPEGLKINVWSTQQTFLKDPFVGDIYSGTNVTISNAGTTNNGTIPRLDFSFNLDNIVVPKTFLVGAFSSSAPAQGGYFFWRADNGLGESAVSVTDQNPIPQSLNHPQTLRIEGFQATPPLVPEPISPGFLFGALAVIGAAVTLKHKAGSYVKSPLSNS